MFHIAWHEYKIFLTAKCSYLFSIHVFVFGHGYFGCFDNPDICIISLFTPCYQFGKNADTVKESLTTPTYYLEIEQFQEVGLNAPFKLFMLTLR
jgi:hypothetical protein